MTEESKNAARDADDVTRERATRDSLTSDETARDRLVRKDRDVVSRDVTRDRVLREERPVREEGAVSHDVDALPAVRPENDGTARDWTNKPAMRDLGLLLVRLYGLTLFLHGLHKAMNFTTFRDTLTHFPLSSASPTVFAWLVILGQLCLGFFVALGLMTRLAAFLIAFMLFVIWLIVHVFAAKNGGLISPQTGGPNGESAILWVALMLPLVFTGAGRWSLDQILSRRRGTREAG